ncbi:MAG: hypothetical protein ACXVGR_13985, partial [Mycobacteriaceae bacterium]
WGPGGKVANPDDWWVGPGYTDFLAADTYMDTWQADAEGNPKPLGDDPAQLGWHDWAVGKGKPLLVAECGVSQGFTDAQRAAYYRASAAWLREQGYRMLLLWNARSDSDGKGWVFFGGARAWRRTLAAVREIARSGDADTGL